MKKLFALTALAASLLAGCGTAPSDITGGNRVSLGVFAADAPSRLVVTQTYVKPTVDKDTGVTTPGYYTYRKESTGSVNFTFMTRPGSDAVYIRGYRILRYDYNGKVSSGGETRALDIYVPSGYICPERTSGQLAAWQSCRQFNNDGTVRNDTVPANGLPINTLSINFADALYAEMVNTQSSAYSEIDLQFFGDSSNGKTVTIDVKGISSVGTLQTQ